MWADYVPDILEKRGPYRPGHIELAQALEAEGKMLLGGAWGAPVDGALFIFVVNSADGKLICEHLIYEKLSSADKRTWYRIRIIECAVLCTEVQQFVDKDPYIEGGLVTKVTIRPVAAAVGTWVTAAKRWETWNLPS